MSEGKIFSSAAPRRFEFESDSFAFANELVWEYHFDDVTGKPSFRPREPKPAYAHRCFVLTRAARQFLYHARFDPNQKEPDIETLRLLVRRIISRSPRVPSGSAEQVVIPGFANVREFSRVHEALLKATCGGAWRSYVLRSHWRMVLPISRRHQEKTAMSLLAKLKKGFSPIVHVVKFPALTINHGMILFDVSETPKEYRFSVYDPNAPSHPTHLNFDRGRRTFSLPQNTYWAGGELDVIEIYRNWWT